MAAGRLVAVRVPLRAATVTAPVVESACASALGERAQALGAAVERGARRRRRPRAPASVHSTRSGASSPAARTEHAEAILGHSASMKPRMRSPRVVGLRRVVLLAAVEERVRRALVGVDLVLDRQRGVERGDLVGRDVLVVAGEQAEHRDLGLGRAVERPALAVALERAVEADDARQAGVAQRGRHERLRAAEAEADRDRAIGAERGERGLDVERDGLGRRLRDVRRVLEGLVARAEPGGAAEVVDRDRRVPGGGEAVGQLLVEAGTGRARRAARRRRSARRRGRGRR